MKVIGDAGTYTPPAGGDPNHWVVHLDSDDLSLGTYSIPAGGLDDQTPHTEDEIYVVQAGRATLVTPSGNAAVGPGSVVFVPADHPERAMATASSMPRRASSSARSLPGSPA
ncbi:MAG: cupin domain-containing protein [Streptosporangiaceae bacterium]